MFEFFIALFGGLFWGGKLSNEKSSAKKADQDHQHRMDTYFSRKNSFERKVLDRELEADLEDLIFDTSNYDKVWAEVSKAFDEMPWKPDDEQFIFICPEAVDAVFGKGTYTKKQKEQIAANYRKEALRIMMANRGKLTHNDVCVGFYSIGQGAPTTRMGEKWNAESANFVLWINSKLKEHGVDENVYICTSHNEYWAINEKTKTYSGKCVWFPEILPTGANIHT